MPLFSSKVYYFSWYLIKDASFSFVLSPGSHIRVLLGRQHQRWLLSFSSLTNPNVASYRIWAFKGVTWHSGMTSCGGLTITSKSVPWKLGELCQSIAMGLSQESARSHHLTSQLTWKHCPVLPYASPQYFQHHNLLQNSVGVLI